MTLQMISVTFTDLDTTFNDDLNLNITFEQLPRRGDVIVYKDKKYLVADRYATVAKATESSHCLHYLVKLRLT